MVADQYPDTVIPFYGWGSQDLFYDGQAIHANRNQAQIIGVNQIGPILSSLIGPFSDDRVNSCFDRINGLNQFPPSGTPYRPQSGGGDSSSDTFALNSQQLIVGAWERYLTITIPSHPNPFYSEDFFQTTAPINWPFGSGSSGRADQGVESITVVGGTVVCKLGSIYTDSDLHAGGQGLVQIFTFTSNGTQAKPSMEIRFRGGKKVAGAQDWSFYQYMSAGKKYLASCGLSIEVLEGAVVSNYEHYIALAYPDNVSGRVSESMRTLDAAGSGGADHFDYTVSENPCIFPTFSVTQNPTAGSWIFKIVLAKEGTVRVGFSRMTIRQINDSADGHIAQILPNGQPPGTLGPVEE